MTAPSRLLGARLVHLLLPLLLPALSLLPRGASASSLPAGGTVGTAPPSGRAAAPLAASKKPAAAKAAASKVLRNKSQAVVLYHVNGRDTLRLRLSDDRGRPVPGMQRQVEQFLRCRHTNKRHAINPRLVRLLYETGRHYAGRRIDVISGYRHPSVAKNPRSPHKKGLACDMRVEGIKNTDLRDYFRQAYKNVGVGYYPNSSFVHLDVRKGPSAFWIDYSGPGETAVYSDNAAEDLRTGRAEGWKRGGFDSNWVDDDEYADGAQPQPAAAPAAPDVAPTLSAPAAP